MFFIMGELKEFQKDLTPKILASTISAKHFLDSKQHKFFGRKSRLTFGQRAADNIAIWAGSWGFITLFLVFLLLWVWVNIYYLATRPFDPYPFILLNLFLSMLAAIQAPIILMSQNRASERDRMRAEYDYAVNRKAEKEIRGIQKDLETIKASLKIKS
tara:strand:- start:86 stop:559 length:474 start_codon:yes stop_codon:yes gene_type:complete